MNNHKRKGQVFSTDFASSILIFGVILSMFLITWNIVVAQPSETAELDLRQQTYQASDTLIKTQGLNFTGGTNWEDTSTSNIQYPGLQSKHENTHNLSKNKIQELDSLSASAVSSKFDLPNIYIKINIDEGADIYEIGNENELSNAETIIPVERHAVVKDNGIKPVKINLTSYR